MALSVGEIEALLRLRDELTPALQLASQQVTKTGDDLKKFGSTLQSAGAAMLPLSLAAAATGGAIVSIGKQFETTIAKIRSLADTSADDLSSMRAAILDLGPKVGQGPLALADTLYTLTSTGLDAKTAMLVLNDAAKASAVGMGDANEVARTLTSAINAYGKENLSSSTAAEVLFKTVREGGAEADEVAGALGRVVGITAQVGVSFQEVGTFIATFTRLGVDADEAVTALRGTMTTVLRPTQQAREELISLGTSVEELRKNIKEKGLAAALTELVSLTKGNEDALAAVIPNVRALAGVLGTAGRQAEAMAEIQRKMGEQTDDLGDAFARVGDTLDFKFNQRMAQLQTIAVRVFDAFKNTLKSATDSMGPFIDMMDAVSEAFAKLPNSIKGVTVALVALTAVAAPLLIGIGSLIRLAGFAAGGFATLLKVLGPVAAEGEAAGVGLAAAGAGASALTFGLAAIVVPAALVTIVELLRQMHGIIADAKQWQLNGIAQNAIDLRAMAEASKVAQRNVTDIGDAMKVLRAEALRLQQVNFAKEMQGVTIDLHGTAKAADEAAHHVATLSEQFKAAQAGMAALSAAQRADIKAGDDLGRSVKEIAEGTKINANVVQLYVDNLHKQEQAERTAGNATRERLKSHEDLARALSAAQVAGLSDNQILDEYGDKAIQAADDTVVFKDALDGLTGSFATLARAQAANALSRPKGSEVATGLPAMPDSSNAYWDRLFDERDKAETAALDRSAQRQINAAQEQLARDTALGVSHARLLQDEEALDEARMQAAVASENRRFELESRNVDKTSGLYETLAAAHKQAVDTIVEQWQAGVQQRLASELTFGESFRAGLKGAFASLGPSIMGALQGGGNILKSVAGGFGSALTDGLFGKDSAAAKGISKALPNLLGDTINSFLPGVGALIGPLAGKIGEAFSNLFGGEGKKTNKERDSFITKLVGIDDLPEAQAALRQLAADGKITAEHMNAIFAAKNRDQLHEAMLQVQDDMKAWDEEQQKIKEHQDELTAAVERYKVQASDLTPAAAAEMMADKVKELTKQWELLAEAGVTEEARLRLMKDDYVDLALAAVKSGQEIPAALQPIILQLAQMGELTEAQAKALLGLGETAGTSFKDMTSAAERYGISLDELGEKYQQLRLDDTAKQLTDDWKTLVTDGGAPAREVLAGMADDIQDVIDNSAKFGTKIPESMKPIIEKGIEYGYLLDGHGKKLTSLSELQWAPPIADATQTLIDKLTGTTEQVDILHGRLDDLPDVDRTITYHIEYDGEFPTGGHEDRTTGPNEPGADRGEPGFAFGTHGRYLNFGSGTTVRLHGRERVMTESEGMQEGGTQQVNVYLDGQVIAQTVARNLPAVLEVYGAR